MRLPTVNIRNAESLGRNNIAAVGGVASAVGSLAGAQAQALQYLGKIGGEFIRREETSVFKTALTNTENSESKFVEEEAVKESYTGEELAGRVKNTELYNIGADKNGKETKTLKKNIPAYKVYPQLLANKLRGDMETYANTIINPIDKKAYLENRSVAINKKISAAMLKAEREQYLVLRDESDARRADALANGNLEQADLEAESFDGTDFEISERLRVNAEENEVWTGDRLIQIEDKHGIEIMLNRLQDPKYKQKGGPLPERPNINLQNRLRGKLSSLEIRRGNIDRVMKEETRQEAQDAIKALENGDMLDSNYVDGLRARLKGVKLKGLDIDVRRADKMASFIDFMYKHPTTDHEPAINKLLPSVAEGPKAVAFKEFLLKKSEQIDREIQKDGNGLYQKRNISDAPQPRDKNFFAKSVRAGKLASDQYKIKAKPLTDEVATSLSEKFRNATIKAKQQFIEEVIPQVREKADRDAIFIQIDKKGAGNLNVYADIIERGESETIKIIDEGKLLRQDNKLDLNPPGIDGKLNTELNQVFKLNIELQSYREAIKDYYAKTANDDGEFGRLTVNTSRLDIAIKAVVGNIVKYDGRNFLLPNNTLDASGFDDWLTDTSFKYIDEMGGVMNKTSKSVMSAIRDEDFKLRPSLTRGEYLVIDADGNYLMKADTKNGEFIPFKLVYDRNAPLRKVISWQEFGEMQQGK